MKFEQIDAALKRAGFQLINEGTEYEGTGFGIAAEGRSYLYQKGISARTSQTIQVVVSAKDENIVKPIFSLNVPVKVRDLIYAITNEANMENAVRAEI